MFLEKVCQEIVPLSNLPSFFEVLLMEGNLRQDRRISGKASQNADVEPRLTDAPLFNIIAATYGPKTILEMGSLV